ncbi:small membrane protein [Streptomyces albospinus]|uniref:Small membrane protein n=1 Tax=Streptomyces albospinus TaxID=285515 RepID=A0ABQ2VRN5_9ACTN|nr:chaplin [Streptomyces albospinus]GGV04137.1 small membrane protein [Streptomyces albospinus]
MKNIKRVAAITMASAGLALAGAGVASADDAPQAQGAAVASPGVVSGNTVQAPADVSANTCGNTVSAVGLLNPAYGNKCGN